MPGLIGILNRVRASNVLDGESASSYSREVWEFRPIAMIELSRRNFLLRAGTSLGAAWVTTNWPALLSAATHAHNAARATPPPKYEFFTPAEAAEIEVITARIIPTDDTPRRAFRARPGAQSFFETLRQHTIAGFLIDPEYGGNHDGVGWKVIGREREHMFQAPFGYYDKDYSGWQPVAKEAEKK